MVLAVLLVIGGVEKNPGPPKRTKGHQETSDPLYLGEDYNSDDVFSTDLFSVPTTMSITKFLPVPRPKYKGRWKKISKIFRGTPRFAVSSTPSEDAQSDAIIDSQSNVTDHFETLCKIPRIGAASSQSSLELSQIATSSSSTFVEEGFNNAQKN